MNKAAFAEVTVTEYVAMFDEAVHHWDKPFGVTMSPSDWIFFLFGTRPQTPPSGQHPPLQATFPVAVLSAIWQSSGVCCR